ncbi:acyl-coenzyme A thioesterase THEM5 [Suncus etruscus]|uniref:acyl-coenzyme A thioesterase THEM5 n=1 Tax=Suncus etruscus TaxID=109475 RepID=UPI00210FD480|nr:acyl-coenzyme A thioesterase THEM5 [Suncus etruscus]
MLRKSFQVAARLVPPQALPGAFRILPRVIPASAFGSSPDALVARFCVERPDTKDYAVPNASWCPDMLSLYQEFMGKTKGEGWVKLPSFKSNRDHVKGLKLPSGLGCEDASDNSDWRIFTRCIPQEGQGYEYVIFFHPTELKSVCLFQPGPNLEGAPGYAHGGSLTALIDETFSKTAYLAAEGLFTVNLNIRFKNLIPVRSLIVLNVDVTKTDEQQVHLSCIAQSRDEQTVYAKCSGVFLQLPLEEEEPQ